MSLSLAVLSLFVTSSRRQLAGRRARAAARIMVAHSPAVMRAVGSTAGGSLAALFCAPYEGDEGLIFTHGARMSNTERLRRITFSAKNPCRDIFKEVDLRTRERQAADSKLSYGDALAAVFRADEDLHRAYLDNVPPLRRNAQE